MADGQAQPAAQVVPQVAPSSWNFYWKSEEMVHPDARIYSTSEKSWWRDQVQHLIDIVGLLEPNMIDLFWRILSIPMRIQLHSKILSSCAMDSTPMKISSCIIVKSTCTSTKDLNKMLKTLLINSSLASFKLKSWYFLQVMFLENRRVCVEFLQKSKRRLERVLLQEATLKQKEEIWKLLVLMERLSKFLLNVLLNVMFVLSRNRWMKW